MRLDVSSFPERRVRSVAARATLLVAVVGAFLAVLLAAPSRAEAYPWMMRHEYTACGSCHTDPSGGGILTMYGRAQGEILLRTHYGKPAEESEEEDPAKLGGFAFGAFELPEWLLLQADLRNLLLHVAPPSPAPSTTRMVLMQADAAAAISVGRLRMSGTLGYVHEGALPASVTTGLEDRMVSRQHWLGVALGEDEQFLLRAGRMNLPFGLRIIEHTSFIRSSTRTDINAAQQHGVAFAWNAEGWRAEVMGIAGNFQLAPDVLRDRGAAAYIERAFSPKVAVGLTSLVTHAELDLEVQTAAFRQAHGAFGRFVVAKPVVLMAEVDLLVRSPKRQEMAIGTAGHIQADVEPIQGVHFAATAEAMSRDFSDGLSMGGWLSAFWFFLPHVDIRADLIHRSFSAGDTTSSVTSLLAQLHGRL